jgi:hypothetical protein
VNEIAHSSGRKVEIYDPDRGLKEIAVAEAAEKHWARAKDAKKLLEAVEVKLKKQRDYIAWRDGVTGGRGGRQNRGTVILPEGDPGHAVAHRWRKKLDDDASFNRTLEDAQHRCVRICEQEKTGTVRGTEGTGEFELYTPAEYVELVRDVLGEIDLDPASNAEAQATVRAKEFYTVADDGLEREWHGRVFLNPPYHRELLPRFVDKLLTEWAEGPVSEAIMLTNNATDTEWFYVAQGAA